MQDKQKTVCIFGGSGFIGKYVTQDLARAGYRIKVVTRIPESAYALKTYGNVGQVVAVNCNYRDQASLEAVIDGCDTVINLTGILFEKRRSKFQYVHCDLPKNIAEICAEKNVQKFIHVSACGVDKANSKYAASKCAGEKQVLESYPSATILRPSVVFGPGDSFFNMFAKLASFLPFLPLIGGGKTKFQPVYVGDISEAITNIVASQNDNFLGKTYELCGPDIVSFKEIYQLLLSEINRNTTLVRVPWAVAKIQGFFFGLLPKPLLTVDQVRSLKTDNIMSKDALSLKDIGVESTAMRTILPHYLSNFKKGGRFLKLQDVPKIDKKTA
jgi:NADH dehydrogenase